MNIYPKGIPRILAFCLFAASSCWAGGDYNFETNEPWVYSSQRFNKDSWKKTLLKWKKDKLKTPKQGQNNDKDTNSYINIVYYQYQFKNMIEKISQKNKVLGEELATEFEVVFNELGSEEQQSFRDFFTKLYVEHLNLCIHTLNDPSIGLSAPELLRLKELYSVGLKHDWFDRFKVNLRYLGEIIGVDSNTL